MGTSSGLGRYTIDDGLDQRSDTVPMMRTIRLPEQKSQVRRSHVKGIDKLLFVCNEGML